MSQELYNDVLAERLANGMCCNLKCALEGAKTHLTQGLLAVKKSDEIQYKFCSPKCKKLKEEQSL